LLLPFLCLSLSGHPTNQIFFCFVLLFSTIFKCSGNSAHEAGKMVNKTELILIKKKLEDFKDATDLFITNVDEIKTNFEKVCYLIASTFFCCKYFISSYSCANSWSKKIMYHL